MTYVLFYYADCSSSLSFNVEMLLHFLEFVTSVTLATAIRTNSIRSVPSSMSKQFFVRRALCSLIIVKVSCKSIRICMHGRVHYRSINIRVIMQKVPLS